jgi:hypothetical protein
MKKDIHKLADYLVQVTREGIAAENKLLEWKQAEEARAVAKPVSNAISKAR